ncbi:MAG: hypothetical protein U1E61_17400 [Bradyrhizobium sp.]
MDTHDHIRTLEAEIAALRSVVQFLLVRMVSGEADPIAAIRELDGFLREVAYLDGGREDAHVAMDELLEPVTLFASALKRKR